jgi:hypothetical protein
LEEAVGDYAVIGGGQYNLATGDYSVILGGDTNYALGAYSMVPGGSNNTAGGNYSFAAGRYAIVREAQGDHGSFVWADSQNASIQSKGTDQFIVRASGGIWLGTSSSVSIGSGRFIDTSTGAYLTTGGTWTNSSDRHAKENFELLDVHEVLERVAELPITKWNFKTEGRGVEHLGPMAQDFHATFGLGDGDKAIGTLDADGVALAAVQGLRHAILEEECELAEIESANRALESRIRVLETALTRIIASKSFGRRP